MLAAIRLCLFRGPITVATWSLKALSRVGISRDSVDRYHQSRLTVYRVNNWAPSYCTCACDSYRECRLEKQWSDTSIILHQK